MNGLFEFIGVFSISCIFLSTSLLCGLSFTLNWSGGLKALFVMLTAASLVTMTSLFMEIR